MNPIDEPHADSDAPMPELLEDYKNHHAKLQAHARELQRLRDQVRSTAEREAAAIVTNARHDVRKLLLDARHELLVLVAQLQAVGCETQASDRSVELQGETTDSAGADDPFAPTREVVSTARRDMRDVLLEARAGLVSLADEGRELRAHVVEQRSMQNESATFLPEVPAPVDAAIEAAPVASSISHASTRSSQDSMFVVHDSRHSTPESRTVNHLAVPIAKPAVAARVAVRHRALSPMHYTAPTPSRSMWVAGAGALGFAAFGVLLFLWPGAQRESTAARRADTSASQASARPAVVRTVSDRTASPSAAASTTNAATPAAQQDPSIVSIVLDARRTSWVRATIDGAADSGRMFAAGETKTLTARQDVVLRVGDAGAVLVSVDGQPAKALGIDGQVVTRRFAPRQPRAVALAADASAKTPPRTPSVVPAVAANAAPPVPAPVHETAPARADVGTAGTIDPAPVAPAKVAPPAATVAQPPARPQLTPELEILNANSRWFEAYYAGDRATMQAFAAPDFTLADERTGNRLPAAPMGGVQRSMDQVRVEVAGDGAVLSARLIERLTVDGSTVQHISMVSQVWIRQSGRWRLVNVRFVDAANLGLG
jgi:hypothetical protein